MLIPVIVLNIPAERCGWLPLPAELYSSSPGCFFANAMNSLTVFTGTELCTTSTCEVETSIVIGVKSLTVSYVSLLYKLRIDGVCG